jgi:hypothetical protein
MRGSDAGEPKLHGKRPSGASVASRLGLVVGVLAVLAGLAVWAIKPRAKRVDLGRTPITPQRLRAHCEGHIGEPRVIEVRWMACCVCSCPPVCVCVSLRPSSKDRPRAPWLSRAGIS